MHRKDRHRGPVSLDASHWTVEAFSQPTAGRLPKLLSPGLEHPLGSFHSVIYMHALGSTATDAARNWLAREFLQEGVRERRQKLKGPILAQTGGWQTSGEASTHKLFDGQSTESVPLKLKTCQANPPCLLASVVPGEFFLLLFPNYRFLYRCGERTLKAGRKWG